MILEHMILISENDMLNSANLQGAGPREYKNVKFCPNPRFRRIVQNIT